MALAAIQGLNAKLEAKAAEKDAEIAMPRERLAKVETGYAMLPLSISPSTI